MADEQGGGVIVQEMRIERAPDWQDRSMLVLARPRPDGIGPDANLVVTREPLAGTGDDADAIARRVNAHADRQRDAARGQPGYEEIMHARAVPERPVAELRLVWTDGAVPLAQWLTFTAAPRDTVVVTACTAARADIAAVEEATRAMLATLRIE